MRWSWWFVSCRFLALSVITCLQAPVFPCPGVLPKSARCVPSLSVVSLECWISILCLLLCYISPSHSLYCNCYFSIGVFFLASWCVDGWSKIAHGFTENCSVELSLLSWFLQHGLLRTEFQKISSCVVLEWFSATRELDDPPPCLTVCGWSELSLDFACSCSIEFISCSQFVL